MVFSSFKITIPTITDEYTALPSITPEYTFASDSLALFDKHRGLQQASNLVPVGQCLCWRRGQPYSFPAKEHQFIQLFSVVSKLVMLRLSQIIDCRSIIAKNPDYRSKISKIDHRKHIMYEMRNVENRMHSVRIRYYLKYGGAHRLE